MPQSVAAYTTYMETRAAEVGLRLGLSDLRDVDPQSKAIIKAVLAMTATVIYVLVAKGVCTDAELDAVLNNAMSQLPPMPPNITWP